MLSLTLIELILTYLGYIIHQAELLAIYSPNGNVLPCRGVCHDHIGQVTPRTCLLFKVDHGIVFAKPSNNLLPGILACSRQSRFITLGKAQRCEI